MAKKLKRKKQVQDGQGGGNRLSMNAGRIGTALAGVVLAEVVEIAVERLLQKRSHSTTTDENNSNASKSDYNPLQQASAGVQDAAAKTKPALTDAVDVVRLILTEFSPALAHTLDSLQSNAGGVIDQALSTEQNATKKMASSVVDTAQKVMSAVGQTNVGVLDKKGKKKKKKSN